jgi:hypothetical protein
MLDSYLLRRPIIIVDMLLRRIFTRQWWERRQFEGYYGSFSFITSTPFYWKLNVKGWEIVIVFSLASWRPNPRIIGFETLALYLIQYSELRPLISLFPSIYLQSLSTISSQDSYFSGYDEWSIFKLHQLALSFKFWYLFAKGVRLKVGDRSVVSVRIDTA